MEDIFAAVFGAIYGIVKIFVRFPIVIVLVVAGVGASMIGGTAGWLGFIAASLITTAVFRRFLRRDIKKALAAWLFLHVAPIVACVLYFVGLDREPLGLAIGAAWIIALVLIGWKVPSRPETVAPPAHDGVAPRPDREPR